MKRRINPIKSGRTPFGEGEMGLFNRLRNAAKGTLTGAFKGLSKLKNGAQRADVYTGTPRRESETWKTFEPPKASSTPRSEPPKSKPEPPKKKSGGLFGKIKNFFGKKRQISEDTEADRARMEEEIRLAEEAQKKKAERAQPPASGRNESPPAPFEPAGAGGLSLDDNALEWARSGKWQLVKGSTNVYGFMYDGRKEALFVRYLHWEPGMPYGARSGPGAIYRYDSVSEAEAVGIYKASSDGFAGEWIWDHIRIHGSWSGHQKPMQLVAVQNNYVPRIAEGPMDGPDGYGEYFVPREVASKGRRMSSQLPLQKAPDLWYYGDRAAAYRNKYGYPPNWPARALPNNGRPNPPNNGKPNAGRP